MGENHDRLPPVSWRAASAPRRGVVPRPEANDCPEWCSTDDRARRRAHRRMVRSWASVTVRTGRLLPRVSQRVTDGGLPAKRSTIDEARGHRSCHRLGDGSQMPGSSVVTRCHLRVTDGPSGEFPRTCGSQCRKVGPTPDGLHERLERTGRIVPSGAD